MCPAIRPVSIAAAQVQSVVVAGMMENYNF